MKIKDKKDVLGLLLVLGFAVLVFASIFTTSAPGIIPQATTILMTMR